MFNIGDKVSVLDDAIDGIVTKIQKDVITVETTDGFELNFAPKEIDFNCDGSHFINFIPSTNFLFSFRIIIIFYFCFLASSICNFFV